MMEVLSYMAVVFREPWLILLVAAGTCAGVYVGAIPGLSGTMAVSLLVSFTFGWETNSALAVMIGVFVGAVFGGSRSAILLRLWQYLGRNRTLVILAVLLSVSGTMLASYGPKISGEAINAIDLGAGKVDFDTVIRCCGLMVVCYILSSGLSYLLSLVMLKLSRTVAKQMRHDVFENLSSLPVSFFDQYQTGDLISTITYDVDTVNQSLSNDMLQILQSVVTVVISFVMMMTIAPKLVLVFVFTIPITVVFTRWLARRVRPLFRKRSAKLGQLNGFVRRCSPARRPSGPMAGRRRC